MRGTNKFSDIAETQVKRAQGKGKSKTFGIGGSVQIALNSCPPPPGRVDLLSKRFDEGLDLFTGLPLTDEGVAEVEIVED